MDKLSSLLLHRDTKIEQFSLCLALGISAAAGFWALIFLLQMPGDPKNAVLGGLSLSRWLMLAVSLGLILLPGAAFFLRDKVHACLAAWSDNRLFTGSSTFLSLLVIAWGIWFFSYWQAHLTDVFINARLLRFVPFAAWLFFLALEYLILLPFYRPGLRLPYLMFVYAILLTALIAGFTNHYAVDQMPWDVKYFYLLAERGFGGQNISPYVYRFGTPFLARAISEIFSLPVYRGYVVVSWIGGCLQLFSIYLLVSLLNAREQREGGTETSQIQSLTFVMSTSLLAMVTIAFTTFNLKYLLFDVSRPDQLAYGLIALAMIALLQDRYLLCALLAALGLQFREYLVIPPLILSLGYAKIWLRNRSSIHLLWRIAILAAISAAAVFLPRLLIPVSEQTQFVDPQNPATLRNLIDMPLNMARNLNYLFSVAAYFLPLLLLSTPARWKRLWDDLKPYRFILGVYILIVLGLTLYGGHDMPRYISYMFLPLVFFLYDLNRQHLPVWEWIYTLCATAGFNRSFGLIPGWDMEQFLDYYGGYGERVNLSSAYRWMELFAWIIIGILLRWIITNYKKRSLIHGHHQS